MCRSDGNKEDYCIPIENGINMLTNKQDGAFTITELEVWQMRFLEKIRPNISYK